MDALSPEPRRWLFADLLKATAAINSVPVAALIGSARGRQFTVQRWRCFYIGRAELGLSYSQIGRLFRRDHTTVIHGVRRYGEIADDPEERALRKRIKDTATLIADGNYVHEAADDQPQ